MELRLVCLIGLVVGYFFGTFETAYFVGKARGIDLRKVGSGNLGTTNVFRVLGIRAGIVTFLGDIIKVFLPLIIGYVVVVMVLKLPIPRIPLYLYIGCGAVLGHDFPFYLKFKGGKGVAATAAVLISLWDWKLVTIGIVVFFGLALATLYVSVASMCLITAEFAGFILLTRIGLIKVDAMWLPDCYVILFILMALIFILHRKNIMRLKNHSENKFRIMSEAEIKASVPNKDKQEK